MKVRLHAVALRVFGLLPKLVRSLVIRLIYPSFTAGTSVVMVDGSDRVLLVTQPYTRGWGLPGGMMRRHEEPATTARREMAEELTIDTGPIDAVPIAVRAPGRRHFDLVFVVSVDAAQAAEIDPTPPEIIDARWFTLDALPHLVDGTDAILASVGLAPRARPSC